MFKLFRALFFDDKGEYLGKKYFNPKEGSFIYKKKRFSYDGQNKTYMNENSYWFIFKRKTYYYYLNSPTPISFEIKKKTYNEINTEQLNVMMETKVIKDINDISKPSLFANLNAKTLIILLIVGIVGYYLLSGGKLF